MKISKSKVKKLTAKGKLTDMTDDGFILLTDNGDDIVEFSAILEHFKDVEIKFEITQSSKSEEEV